MDDGIKDLWSYIQDATKGKIGRREAEKRISKLKNKYGKDAIFGYYTPNLKAAPYNKKHLEELKHFSMNGVWSPQFLKHIAAVGEDVNTNKNIFKRYKNTITGKNIANTKADIKNFKDVYRDKTDHFISVGKDYLKNQKERLYVNRAMKDRDEMAETINSASKYLNKLKRNRALAIAGTAAVPLAVGVGYGLYRHNKKKKQEEENMNKSASYYVDMIEKVALDTTDFDKVDFDRIEPDKIKLDGLESDGVSKFNFDKIKNKINGKNMAIAGTIAIPLTAAAAYGLYERNERKKNNDANQADEDKKEISVPGIASAGLLGNAVRKTVRDI